MTHATVFACVRVLAESVAQLPAILYERGSDGRSKSRATSHPIYPLLHDMPNEEMTSFELREFMMGSLALRGNAACWIGRNGNGEVSELWPLRWDLITLDRSPSQELLYHWNPGIAEAETFRASQIWHVRGISTDGVQGLSPVALMRETIGTGLAAREYSSRFFSQSAAPSGTIEVPVELSDPAYRRMKETWDDRHGGLTGAQKTAILEQGAKWTQTSLSQKDAEFLATIKFNRSEIAGWFRVPPHLIGDLEKATFSNIEHQSIDFVSHSLVPWLRRIEQAATRDLLTVSERGRIYLEHLVEGMLRGDTASRFTAYNTGIQSGWLTRNEVREAENRNPLEGLDEPLEPLNMVPAGYQAAPAEPGSEPSAPPSSEPPPDDAVGVTDKFDEGAALTASSVLNGAQVTSLVDLVKSVQTGELAQGAALEIISIAFGIEPDVASKILSARSGAPGAMIRAAIDAALGGFVAAVEIRPSNALELRNAKRRRRIASGYLPVLAEATARMIRGEEREVRKLAALHLEKRDAATFESAISDLYGEGSAFRGFLIDTLTAPFDGLVRSIWTEAADEIEGEPDGSALGELVALFVSGAVANYAGKSEKRLLELGKLGPDAAGAIDAQFEEWKDARPASHGNRASVQYSRAAARDAYAKGGVRRLRWVTAGDSCPFCSRLDGKIVGIDQEFVADGEKWEADGRPPLVTKKTAHAPLHKGCDCDIAPA
jgi:HK97 family phage portal protein